MTIGRVILLGLLCFFAGMAIAYQQLRPARLPEQREVVGIQGGWIDESLAPGPQRPERDEVPPPAGDPFGAGDAPSQGLAATDDLFFDGQDAFAFLDESAVGVPRERNVVPGSEAVEAPGQTIDGKYELLTFEFLASYDYEDKMVRFTPEPYEDRPLSEIPDRIMAFDGDDVAVEGYMVPMKVDKGKVREFFLTRYPFGCCYGRMPMVTEWVNCFAEDGVEFVPYRPVRVGGKLTVGEERDDKGYLQSVYRLTAEQVEKRPLRPDHSPDHLRRLGQSR